MPFVIVFANDSNCRRLYVDNLVMRGYVAVGSAGVNEARTLLQHRLPELIIVCCVHVGQEGVVEELRNLSALDDVPVVIVTSEPPDRAWMQSWHVAAALPYPLDLRQLVQHLAPWLPKSSREKAQPFETLRVA